MFFSLNYNPFFRQIFSFILYVAITVKTIVFFKRLMGRGEIDSRIHVVVVNILTVFCGGKCGYVWLKRDFKIVKRAHWQLLGGRKIGLFVTIFVHPF